MEIDTVENERRCQILLSEKEVSALLDDLEHALPRKGRGETMQRFLDELTDWIG